MSNFPHLIITVKFLLSCFMCSRNFFIRVILFTPDVTYFFSIANQISKPLVNSNYMHSNITRYLQQCKQENQIQHTMLLGTENSYSWSNKISTYQCPTHKMGQTSYYPTVHKLNIPTSPFPKGFSRFIS